MTMETVPCRFCGTQTPTNPGDPEDIAPGVCPTCFDERLAIATVEAARTADPRVHRELLIAAGLKPEAAELFLSLARGIRPTIVVALARRGPKGGRRDSQSDIRH